MSETEHGRKSITAEERIRNFRMIDDLFFGAVMDNDILLAEKILSLVLEREIKPVSAVAERTEIDLSGRGIRSDLKVIDRKDNRYDLEVQKKKAGMNPKRLSYNLTKISDGIMEKGCNDWNMMKHRCVIMFCESDYFGNGRAVTISETVFDGRSVDTGTTMIYVNCAYRGNDEIGRLIHDMMCSNPENIYDKDIREKVRKVKEGKEIRRMCEVFDTAVRKAVARERQRLNTQKNKLISEKDAVIAQMGNDATRRDAVIVQMGNDVSQRDNVIAQQKYVIRNKDLEIERLKKENEMLRKSASPSS